MPFGLPVPWWKMNMSPKPGNAFIQEMDRFTIHFRSFTYFYQGKIERGMPHRVDFTSQKVYPSHAKMLL